MPHAAIDSAEIRLSVYAIGLRRAAMLLRRATMMNTTMTKMMAATIRTVVGFIKHSPERFYVVATDTLFGGLRPLDGIQLTTDNKRHETTGRAARGIPPQSHHCTFRDSLQQPRFQHEECR